MVCLRNSPVIRPFRPVPVGSFGPRESDVEMEVRKPPLETIEFLAENDVLRSLGAIKEVDVAFPTLIGQVAQDGHQRRDAHASGDEHDAVGLRAVEGETPAGAETLSRSPSRRVSWRWREARPFSSRLTVISQ